MNKTIKELAQEALDVQNACNLSGVVNGMGRAIQNLRDLVPGGNNALHAHPIMKLWADKIASLTGTQTWGGTETMRAYDAVNALAAG